MVDLLVVSLPRNRRSVFCSCPLFEDPLWYQLLSEIVFIISFPSHHDPTRSLRHSSNLYRSRFWTSLFFNLFPHLLFFVISATTPPGIPQCTGLHPSLVSGVFSIKSPPNKSSPKRKLLLPAPNSTSQSSPLKPSPGGLQFLLMPPPKDPY